MLSDEDDYEQELFRMLYTAKKGLKFLILISAAILSWGKSFHVLSDQLKEVTVFRRTLKDKCILKG